MTQVPSCVEESKKDAHPSFSTLSLPLFTFGEKSSHLWLGPTEKSEIFFLLNIIFYPPHV